MLRDLDAAVAIKHPAANGLLEPRRVAHGVVQLHVKRLVLVCQAVAYLAVQTNVEGLRKEQRGRQQQQWRRRPVREEDGAAAVLPGGRPGAAVTRQAAGVLQQQRRRRWRPARYHCPCPGQRLQLLLSQLGASEDYVPGQRGRAQSQLLRQPLLHVLHGGRLQSVDHWHGPSALGALRAWRGLEGDSSQPQPAVRPIMDELWKRVHLRDTRLRDAAGRGRRAVVRRIFFLSILVIFVLVFKVAAPT